VHGDGGDHPLFIRGRRGKIRLRYEGGNRGHVRTARITCSLGAGSGREEGGFLKGRLRRKAPFGKGRPEKNFGPSFRPSRAVPDEVKDPILVHASKRGSRGKVGGRSVEVEQFPSVWGKRGKDGDFRRTDT